MTTQPLSFCMITTFYPPYNFGGDGIFVQRLSNELAGRGHQVEIIHCVDSYHAFEPGTSGGDFQDHPNILVHSLTSPAGRLSPLATQQTGYPLFKRGQLEKILAREFDVIHFHNISLVGGPGILEYGHGIKLCTAHEYWLTCPMHLLLRADGTVCREPNCFTCTLEHKRPPQWWRYSTLLEKSLRNLHALIAPSRFTQTLLNDGELPVPVRHIPNFGASDVPLAEEGDPSASPYFLFVGRLEKAKGLQTLLPMFQKRPDARLVVAGEGKYERELQALARNSPNIQFLGFQSQAQLGSLYRNAQALVLPSLWYEVFPLVALEAFQQQTPLLARNLGALREIVQASGGGWTYDTDEEVETLIDFIPTHPIERAQRGANGYAAYRNDWTAEAHLGRYFDLIEELARKPGGRGLR